MYDLLRVLLAHTQGMAIVLLFAFAFSMAGLNPTAVASAGRMTSVTSMGIMLPVASSGAILMPWIIGIVAEKAGLAAGMASNIVPCVGLIIFTLLVLDAGGINPSYRASSPGAYALKPFVCFSKENNR